MGFFVPVQLGIYLIRPSGSKQATKSGKVKSACEENDERHDHYKENAMLDFDQTHNRFQIFFIFWFLFCAGVSIGMLGFLAWVAIKLLAYFGVI